jgi:hypothetical protein
MPLHTNAVAKDGAASPRTAWIDSEHRDGVTIGPNAGDQAVDQRALAYSWSARDTYDICPAPVGKDFGKGRLGGRIAVLEHGDQAGNGSRFTP